jgi:carbonic anhydrase
MDRLFEGYRQFRTDTWPAQRARYESLAREGQRPETLIIACSDSRVDPQIIFNTGPGELFVARNIAGLVPPYEPDSHYHGTSASLEYAVRVLKVSRVVVLGHARCGGIQAMVEGAPVGAREFVEPWMKIAEPVLQTVPKDLAPGDALTHCEVGAVRLSLANLLSFPWIAEAVSSGRLALHGLRFDVSTGVLTHLRDGQFVPVV